MPTKVRRNGPYAPLSAHYARDDAILTLDAAEDDLAELLFVRGLAYCAGDPRLDGFISDTALQAGVVVRRRRQQKVIDAAGRLADLGVWLRVERGYRIRSWEKWNRTRSEIEKKRADDRDRKSGRGDGPEDDVPLPGDADIPPPDGFDAATPDGFRAESPRVASRATSQYSSTTEHDMTAAAAAATPAAEPLPPPLDQLHAALVAVGIDVAWDLAGNDQAAVVAAVNRVGIPGLVKHAQRRHRPHNPAFSARAFVVGWSALQPRTQLVAVPDEPCDCGGGYPNRRSCPDCRRNDSRTA